MPGWLGRFLLWLDLERSRSLQDRVEAWHAWVDARRGYPWLRAMFRERNGYDLNLDDPQTYHEKVNWRKVHDRRPVFRTILDKYAVRHYVARRIGKDRAEGLFPPLLGVTRKPTADWLRQFPKPVAFKANHGSGWNIFLREGDTPDYDEMALRLNGWLRVRYNRRKQEWGYWGIVPRVVVEPILMDSQGRPATDIKIHVFRGRVPLIQFITGRIERRRQACFLSRDWRRLNLELSSPATLREVPPKPARLAEMLALSRELAQGFDYMRVDFLMVDDRYYLNELTLYAGSGFGRVKPPERDLALGRMWRLPRGGRPFRRPGFLSRMTAWLGLRGKGKGRT